MTDPHVTAGTISVAEAERLLVHHLATVERALSFACRRGAMCDTDAEEFGSWAKLKLIENDYSIIRKFSGRNFPGYIAMVVHRLLLDYRVHLWGKWHASAEAVRQGEVGLSLEIMLFRDGRSLDEAMPALRRIRPDLSRAEAQAIADRLPRRPPRARLVEIEAVGETLSSPAPSVEDTLLAKERNGTWRQIAAIVEGYVYQLSRDDRRAFQLRFGAGMTVAEIARVLRVEQKPLYRQLDRQIIDLQRRLRRAGIPWDVARDLLAHPAPDFDFEFLHAREGRVPVEERRADSPTEILS